jgi:5-methylcytosine-specific restriction endonuclease McrA
MPSSPGYVRDHKQEYKTQKARGENGTGSNSDSAKRHRLRRKMVKEGKVKPGQDVDHKKPLSKGGANTTANARAVSPSINRSFPRNPDGSMKSNSINRKK